MSQSVEKGIYGPIRSQIDIVTDRIRNKANPYSPHFGYRPSQQDTKLAFLGAIYPMHLGVDSPADPKILPALGVVRDFVEKSETDPKTPFKDFINALKPHFRGHQIYWRDQRDTLIQLYHADRQLIDRALDFEEAKKSPTPA